MNIYDYSIKEVLENTQNLTKEDLKRKLDNNLVTIYTVKEYIDELESNDLLEDELAYWDVENKDALEKLFKSEVHSGDGLDTGIYKGCDFVILENIQ